MNKEEINLLKMQLYLDYYKNDITNKYVRVIDNIVLDNDVLNNLDERVYITTLDNYNELKLAKEDNLQLLDKIDKAIEITNKILMNNADNRMICNEEEKEYFDWLDSEMLKQEKILKGSDSDE